MDTPGCYLAAGNVDGLGENKGNGEDEGGEERPQADRPTGPPGTEEPSFFIMFTT